MAIAAAFDLEICQMDAVNAFLNSDIDEDITTEWPPGFGNKDTIWQLCKALYGLKRAPLLWYNHLTRTLSELGLKPVPGVNCLYTNNWLLLFFYVDDIIFLYRAENTAKVEDFTMKLKARYELTTMARADWFLGIRIIRDRPKRRLYLCQDSYIDKLAHRFHIDIAKFDKRTLQTPLSVESLQPYEGQASPSQIQGYQQRIGSVNFAAVMTRPDIAKASSALSQYLTNPSPKHIAAADRVIAYLVKTKYLAILYSAEDNGHLSLEIYPFQVYSDAAFADNRDRKSSDGYIFMLYCGPIDWKASKQNTVTTSSTEAELLALSATAKELKWWQRLYNHIQYYIDGMVEIHSDNQQTIRLLTAPSPQLTTKLRHVDIHQHWLRQEVQNGDIAITWVPTSAMKADGFTKPLPAQSFAQFVKQLNLVDIGSLLQDLSTKQQ
jgi:ribonuclease HI